MSPEAIIALVLIAGGCVLTVTATHLLRNHVLMRREQKVLKRKRAYDQWLRSLQKPEDWKPGPGTWRSFPGPAPAPPPPPPPPPNP